MYCNIVCVSEIKKMVVIKKMPWYGILGMRALWVGCEYSIVNCFSELNHLKHCKHTS